MTKTVFTIDPETFRQDVSIRPNDLQGCFVEHPGLFSFYAACHVEALRKEAAAKVMLEVKEARAGKDFRDAAIKAGEKVTEGTIDKGVTLNAEVIKARLALSEAKAATQLAYHAVEAFKQRRDMLIQMGASAREEMKGAPRIAAQPGMPAGQAAVAALKAHGAG